MRETMRVYSFNYLGIRLAGHLVQDRGNLPKTEPAFSPDCLHVLPCTVVYRLHACHHDCNYIQCGGFSTSLNPRLMMTQLHWLQNFSFFNPWFWFLFNYMHVYKFGYSLLLFIKKAIHRTCVTMSKVSLGQTWFIAHLSHQVHSVQPAREGRCALSRRCGCARPCRVCCGPHMSAWLWRGTMTPPGSANPPPTGR